jgi:hypothetical protein
VDGWFLFRLRAGGSVTSLIRNLTNKKSERPTVMVPGLILEDYGGLSPRVHRLTIALGISGFFWLGFVAVELMLWVVYKAAVPGLTASLSEVGPEIKDQLSSISPQQRGRRLLALVCLLAGLILLGLALVVLTAHRT